MTVSANLFVTDSLVGSTQVKNTFANVSVGTRPLAFIGDQSFVIKLRRNSAEGDVIATTPQITMRDNAALVSFVANTYTVAEGDLVEFTLTTTGAANNAVLYYSTLDATPNVDVQDFFGSNVGSFTLVDNVGTIVLRANTDGSVVDETGETFKLQIRTGSVTGNVVLVSDNVAILDTSNTSSYFISQTTTSVLEGDSVTFTINTVNVPDGTEVFYTTAGNVRSYNFTTANTGSFIVVNGSNTIELIGTAIPSNEVRQFSLQIRENSLSGQIKATGDSTTISDTNLATGISATGGTITDSAGYRIHAFTSSANLQISSISSVPSYNSLDYLVVGGGGGGGNRTGGGAGGLRTGNILLTPADITSHSIIIGAEGSTNIGPAQGESGGTSSFYNISSAGGGGGGGDSGTGGSGGSGGGGYGSTSPNSGLGNIPPFTPSQGNPGGQGNPSNGGGGGGAGASGGDFGGPGGNGISISWVPESYGTPGPSPGRWFAGGGGGGVFATPGTPPAGGAGGGGRGGRSNTNNPGGTTAGTTNTGGGGGGFGGGSGLTPTGSQPGGSGIVILRYPLPVQSTFALTESSVSIGNTSNVTFSVITTNVANNSILYYRTSGNVISSDFIQSNTGSFAVINNIANITLTANIELTGSEERVFTFQVLEGAVDGDVILVSNTITVSIPPPYILATGGTIVDNGGYRIHSFTSSGNLVISSLGDSPVYNNVEYLVVAGGGGGGSSGAGGAGEFLASNTIIASTGQYNVIVGAGGSGIHASQTNGSDSSIFGINSLGGGYGGYGVPLGGEPAISMRSGRPGGSGGGASYFSGPLGPSVAGQAVNPGIGRGNPGGIGYTPSGPFRGGGGGGANQAGRPGASVPLGGGAGKGGDGAPSTITGANVIYAGGGGGGHTDVPNAGLGGGGEGAPASPINVVNPGTNNTGGGGGGGNASGSSDGGNGGSGIVIIRYLIPIT